MQVFTITKDGGSAYEGLTAIYSDTLNPTIVCPRGFRIVVDNILAAPIPEDQAVAALNLVASDAPEGEIFVTVPLVGGDVTHFSPRISVACPAGASLITDTTLEGGYHAIVCYHLEPAPVDETGDADPALLVPTLASASLSVDLEGNVTTELTFTPDGVSALLDLETYVSHDEEATWVYSATYPARTWLTSEFVPVAEVSEKYFYRARYVNPATGEAGEFSTSIESTIVT